LAKPPSWNEIKTNAAAFSSRWADETQENAEAQTFWNEFLAIFGIDRKRVASFERRAQRHSTGGRGRIDLFWPGTLAAEHKSAGEDLEKAEVQALDYLTSIDEADFPGVVVTSDFAHIRILDLSGDNEPYEFPLTDLVEEIDRFGFIAGYSRRHFSAAHEEAASIEAARFMGRLYEQLSRAGYEGHEASVFMTRLLFLLFGDDTGMWEKALFQEFIETRTQPDGSDLGPQLAFLFQVLDRPETSRPTSLDELLARFPYVNGGLFTDRLDIPSFDRLMREELLACCAFDWGEISPAIFGSMFQSIKDRLARRTLGEHYTTEQSILKTLQPLFLDDLRADFEEARHSTTRLRRLRERLGKMRYLDPACGCGNFLVVAYRELRRLELEIMVCLRYLTGDDQLKLDPTLGLQVRLDQFFGIEIEEWPARIAETAMFLVDHQANKSMEAEFGKAPERLPIEVAASILLDNAIHVEWSSLLPSGDGVFVFGNPPFVGMGRMTTDQQADNRLAFAQIIGADRTGRFDYVACWYAKAISYMAGTTTRAAFVSTNSIAQGEQARSLGPMLANNGFDIDFAHRTFEWTSEAPGAAVVHVVIIGFSAGGQARIKHLYDYPDIRANPIATTVPHINIYLANSDVVAIRKHSTPLVPVPKLIEGNRPQDGGGLIVSDLERDAIIASDPIAAKYLRRLVGAHDMLHNQFRWCFWLVDADPAEITKSAIIRERLEIVVAARLASPTPSARDHARTPGLFLAMRQPQSRWLCVPAHSSANRRFVPMAFFDARDIAHNSVLLIDGADECLFGFLQSSMFITWVRTVSGRIKSDIRLSSDLSYNSFPFPGDLSTDQRDRLADAARGVLAAREAFPEAALADLYDPLTMPLRLVEAHAALDRAVDGLFAKRPFATDAERLAALFSRYDELAAPLAAAIPRRGARKRSAQ